MRPSLAPHFATSRHRLDMALLLAAFGLGATLGWLATRSGAAGAAPLPRPAAGLGQAASTTAPATAFLPLLNAGAARDCAARLSVQNLSARPAKALLLAWTDPDTGAPLPTGEVGEITIHGPGNFKGYWNKPEATAKTLRDGWVYTGDMGKIDVDGYLTFIGRFKEMIKVSGYSVFPEEVETILIKHPAVAQAAVIAQPDAEKGEVVKAYIVLKPGAQVDEAQLIAWSRENMALYKTPRMVRFIDALPTTGAGKVLRRLLKDKE